MNQRRRLLELAAPLLALACAAHAESPAQTSSSLSERQQALLVANCTQCHARPGIGAPLIGDEAAWKHRRAQGEDRMLANVVLGLRGMPPLGYCSACSEQDLRALIRVVAGVH